jgi:hypothetical protein
LTLHFSLVWEADLRWRLSRIKVLSMKTNTEGRQRYKILDSHRNQTFVDVIRKDPDTDRWTWKGHIDFDDGHNFSFASQRSFTSKEEAEVCMRRFACDRIDNRLSSLQAQRL